VRDDLMNVALVAYLICCLALILVDGIAVYHNRAFLLRFGIYSPYFIKMGKEEPRFLDSFGVVKKWYRSRYNYSYPVDKRGRIIEESEEEYIMKRYGMEQHISPTDWIKYFWWFPYLFFLLVLVLTYPSLPEAFRVVVPPVALLISSGASLGFFVGFGNITPVWVLVYTILLFLVGYIDLTQPQLLSEVFNLYGSQFWSVVTLLTGLWGSSVWYMMKVLFPSEEYIRQEKNLLAARILTGALGVAALIAMLFLTYS
jgi:hypothetical protein